jgi:hypothetical protein
MTTLRIAPETRDRLLAVAAEDFGGVPADEAVRRLLDEHWQWRALQAMEAFRAEDPAGWQEYLDEAAVLEQASLAPLDEWIDSP